MTGLPAVRFDGRRAAAAPVVVRVEHGSVVVETPEGFVVDREPLDRVRIPEPFDAPPRLVYLPGDVTLEVPDGDRAFARALQHAGIALSPVVRLQRWWPAALVALAAVLGLLVVLYTEGLPRGARWLAFALPSRYEARIGTELLITLDRHYLSPTRLSPEAREAIAERFGRAAGAIAGETAWRLEFRGTRSRGQQVNAMALPGGAIVLLDGLVLESDPDAVLGVLGHELGHVVGKHSMRQLLQSVGVGTIAGLLWGDFSSVAASAVVVVGVLSYSRDFEREADEFAVRMLRSQGVSVRPLYEFFKKLPDLRHDGPLPGFLSTHPSTDERLERLRRELPPQSLTLTSSSASRPRTAPSTRGSGSGSAPTPPPAGRVR